MKRIVIIVLVLAAVLVGAYAGLGRAMATPIHWRDEVVIDRDAKEVFACLQTISAWERAFDSGEWVIHEPSGIDGAATIQFGEFETEFKFLRVQAPTKVTTKYTLPPPFGEAEANAKVAEEDDRARVVLHGKIATHGIAGGWSKFFFDTSFPPDFIEYLGEADCG